MPGAAAGSVSLNSCICVEYAKKRVIVTQEGQEQDVKREKHLQTGRRSSGRRCFDHGLENPANW